MEPSEVYALSREHLGHEASVIATAIAWAESNLNSSAVGDVDLEDDTWGPSVGLWQVRSLRAHTGTGRERDVERLGDPVFNTKAMVVISSHGTNWQPWSVWKSGRYLKHMDAVRAAVTEEEAPMARIYTRADWGARPARGKTSAPEMTRGVGIHWLGDGEGPTGDLAESMAKMRWTQDFHMGPERGWADFAYNAAVDHLGNVFEGRGPRVRNAANGGGSRNGLDANASWASILYLAGTDGPELTPAAMDGINDAAEYLGVAHGEWLGHGDFLSTECPGQRIYGWVHSGHPRGNASPIPQPVPQEEEVTMFVFDAPRERGGEVWVSDGVTRKRVRTGDTWPALEGAGAKHIGVAPIGLFDDLIDIEAVLKALKPDEELVQAGGVDLSAIADLVAAKVADLIHKRLAS